MSSVSHAAFIKHRTNASLVIPELIPAITRLQRAYFRLSSPSEMSFTATTEIFDLLRNTDPYGRPAQRAAQIPPSLYSSILAEAIDAMDQDPSKDAVNLFTELNSSMHGIYDSEGMRSKTFRLNLTEFLAKYDMQFNTGSIKNLPTDGHVKSLLTALVSAGIYFQMCLPEGKNEAGQGGVESFFQDLSYYQAAVNVISSKGLSTKFPALLLVLAGLSCPTSSPTCS